MGSKPRRGSDPFHAGDVISVTRCSGRRAISPAPGMAAPSSITVAVGTLVIRWRARSPERGARMDIVRGLTGAGAARGSQRQRLPCSRPCRNCLSAGTREREHAQHRDQDDPGFANNGGWKPPPAVAGDDADHARNSGGGGFGRAATDAWAPMRRSRRLSRALAGSCPIRSQQNRSPGSCVAAASWAAETIDGAGGHVPE
jgi:hypothetical protein